MKQAQEEPLGDKTNAGRSADLAIVTGLVADQLANWSLEFVGDAPGDQAGRQAPGLKHQDLAAAGAICQQDLRHLGGFSRARGGTQHQMRRDLSGNAVDGQHGFRIQLPGRGRSDRPGGGP